MTNNKTIHVYTKEQDKWLIDNFNAIKGYKELVKTFNETFNVNLKEKNVSRHCNKLGFKKEKNHGVQKLFTKEMDQWIVDTFSPDYNDKVHYQKFQEKFNTNFSYNSFARRRQNLGLFKNRIAVVSGVVAHNSLPFYTERTYDGVLCIKVPYYKSNGGWITKGKYVYEQKYGRVPKNKMIIFLDGDSTNCSLDNLLMVDKSINLRINEKRWGGLGDFTKQVVELMNVEKEIKEILK